MITNVNGDKQEICLETKNYYACLDDSMKSAKCNIDEIAKFSKKIKDFLMKLETGKCKSYMNCDSTTKPSAAPSGNKDNVGRMNHNPWFTFILISLISYLFLQFR
jgi:hypothetical protein